MAVAETTSTSEMVWTTEPTCSKPVLITSMLPLVQTIDTFPPVESTEKVVPCTVAVIARPDCTLKKSSESGMTAKIVLPPWISTDSPFPVLVNVTLAPGWSVAVLLPSVLTTVTISAVCSGTSMRVPSEIVSPLRIEFSGAPPLGVTVTPVALVTGLPDRVICWIVCILWTADSAASDGTIARASMDAASARASEAVCHDRLMGSYDPLATRLRGDVTFGLESKLDPADCAVRRGGLKVLGIRSGERAG